MSSKRRFGIVLIFSALLTVVPSTSYTEEPVERFLARLKDESLHGLAATYLDSIAKAGLISDTLRADLPLEKLVLLQDSLPSIRSPDERAKKTKLIEAGYREFLDKNPKHPRRSEARIQLADILLVRGQELLRKLKSGKGSDSDRQSIRDSLQGSRDLFESTIAELRPILEQMQGNKVGDDAVKIAYRDKIQGEYRQAEILKGLSAKFIAESYPNDAPDYKKWLEKSEAELSEVVKKTTGSSEAGRRILSLLYRGTVQSMLGKVDEAFDSLIQVADIDEGGVFREWRVQATTALVRLQMISKTPKYEPVLNRAEALLKTAQASERATPEWTDLQLAMAESQLAWAATLEGQPSRMKQIKGEARGNLQAIAKRPGPHLEKTRQLLGSLGIETVGKVDDKVPEVKKFADGLAAARERIESTESNSRNLEILRVRMAEVDVKERASIESDIEKLGKSSLVDIRVAEELLRRSIPLFTKEDSRDDLARARYLLAFTLMKREAYWESAAVADFVARNGGEFGLASGGLALFSYDRLLEASEDKKTSSIPQTIEALARYMLTTWPSAKQSEDAALLLIKQAADQERWSDAERYIELLPKEGEKPSQIRREIGVILYGRYLLELDRKRKGKEAITTEDQEALKRAEAMLRAGWDGLTPDRIDQRAVESGNALAAILMKTERLQEAEQILTKSEVGPLDAIRNNSVKLEGRVKLDTLRLRLQGMVLGAGKSGMALDASAVGDVVGDMRKFAQESPDGASRLSRALVQLAQELRDQLDQVKDPGGKSRLADGIHVLIAQLIDVSEDPGILEWGGSLLNTLGQGLESVPTTKPMAVSFFVDGSKAFKKLFDQESKSPGSLSKSNIKPEDIERKLALSLRGQGDFQAAIDRFEASLKSNSKALLSQFEAAKTFEQWGATTRNAENYRKAISGNRGAIWGWATISKNLSRNPDLREYFFESRYHLADCRYNIGLIESGDAKKKELEKAVADLRATAIAFSKIKDSSWYDPMDQLMRNLQRELNKPQIGMQEFFQNPSKEPNNPP